MKQQKGFTLIELAIVMTIIAIMSAAAYPFMFTGYIKRRKIKDAINMVVSMRNAMENVAAACGGYVYGNASASDDFVDMLLGLGCKFPSNDTQADCTVCSYRLNEQLIGKVVDADGDAIVNSEMDQVFDAQLSTGPVAMQADSSNSICGWNSSDINDAGKDLGFYINVNVVGSGAYSTPRISPPIIYCGAVRGPENGAVTLIVMNRDGTGQFDYNGNDLSDPCLTGPWCRVTGGPRPRRGCCRALGFNY